MRHLTKLERGWCGTAFATIYPGVAQGTRIEQMDVDAYIRDLCATVPLLPFIGLRVATLLVALAPLFVLGRFATIRGLPPLERELLLKKLSMSRIYLVRQMVMMLKAIGGMFYAAQPAVRAWMMKPVAPKAKLIELRLKRAPQAA